MYHGPGRAKGLDISCVPCSLSCHVPIRCAAVFKYDSEGSGVLKDGGGGSAGKSSGGICGLLAQAVSNSEQLVTITAQQRLAVTGGIEGSLVFGVHGLLGAAHAGVGSALGRAGGQLLGGGFQPGLGQLSAQASTLELPRQRGGHSGGDHMGVESGDHRPPLHQYHHIAQRIGFMAGPRSHSRCGAGPRMQIARHARGHLARHIAQAPCPR